MSKTDIFTLVLLVLLVVNAIAQRIYIARLRNAMQSLTEAMGRAMGIKVGDRVRGDRTKILP